MKLSIISSALVLATAAARRAEPEIFGRSIRKRTSTIGRGATDVATKVSNRELSAKAPKTFKTFTVKKSEVVDDQSVDDGQGGRLQPKASKTHGGIEPKASKKKAALLPKASKKKVVLLPKASKKKGVLLPKASKKKGVLLPKASKGPKKSKKNSEDDMSFPGSMSYVFPGSSMSYGYPGSMSLWFTDDVDPPTTTVTAPANKPSFSVESAPGESSSDEGGSDPDWGRAIFEYLSNCTGLELPMDSCLVSKTIDAFMTIAEPSNCGVQGRLRTLRASAGSQRRLQASHDSLRFLQDNSDIEDICCAPDFDQRELRNIMEGPKQQCEDEGSEVADELFDKTLLTFLRMFANKDCWDTLCTASQDMSGLFFEALFDEASKCAGVDIDLPQCAMNRVFERIDSQPDSSDSDPCNQPSESALEIFARVIMFEADDVCSRQGDPLSDDEWIRAVSDLVTIFSANQCWGISECDVELPAVEVLDSLLVSNDNAGIPINGNEDIRFDGQECVFEADIDPLLERSLELPFFYRVETATEEEPNLDGIESTLIGLACNEARGERVLSEITPEAGVVAVNSSPEDVISKEYTCLPQSTGAAACHIVEGKVTLTLAGEPTYDEAMKAEAYERIQGLFGLLPLVLNDTEVVNIVYIGTDPPSAISTTTDKANSEETVDDTGSALLIAISGGLVALAALIVGLRRLNKKTETTHEFIQSDEKSSEGSNDGQSTAYNTADITFGSCDRSEAGSIASPSRSLESALAPKAPDSSPAKYVVLAEEEETNWRDLSILPALAQDDGTLEGVSEGDEEGDFISTSSISNGEISV